MSNKDKWSALSMSERADFIKIAVEEGITERKSIIDTFNSLAEGGDTNGEEKVSFWKRLLESGQSARDARVGAVGAQQVRDLYSEGKTEEAQKLAQQYAKANTTGIALASGAATSSLLGDLAVTGATTTADTLIDGNIDNFGRNFLFNAAADVVGHGAGKVVDKVAKTIKATKLAKALNNTKLDDSNLVHGVGVESKIIPLEAKSVALQDAISFEDALIDLNRTEQIKRFNTFAKKYGYEEIGESVSDEILDKATKEMLERHNTFFRGVRPSEEVTNLATKLGISEEEALKIAATTPRAGETHVFVSPTSNAGIYGGGEYVAQVRRPYELGTDRTQWFNEANFEITPGMYSKGNEYFIDPWFSSTSGTTEIPNELLMKKGEFVDWVKGPLEGKGSNNKIFRKYNKTLEIYEPEGLVKFANGGRILNGTNEENQTLSNTPPLIGEGTNETIGFMNSSYNMMNQPIMFNTPYSININKTHNTVEIPQAITNPDTPSTDEKPNTYKVASGDSLGKIAKSNNVPLESLIKANPQIKNPNMISIGQDIIIPQQEIRQSEESKLGGYEVQVGDTLSKIASKNNISLNQLIDLNPQIKTIDSISVGQKINLSNSASKIERQKQWININDLREKETEYNKTNLGAIQGATHDSNYVVIDKKGKKLTVYNANNEVVYETSDISTGLSGNDYNTKTFTRNGKDVYGEGNMSTPAGVTRISSMDMYHGAPSFQRVRLDSYGNPKKVYNDKGEEIDDTINSSFHLGSIDRVYSSNGCVRMSKKALNDLGKYINVGTLIYTLPDKDESRFVLKDGNLSYEADNPYGITEKGKEKNKYGHDMIYQDDYNVFNNKTSSPIKIEYNGNSKSKTKNSNIDKVIDGIASNKEAIQKAFNVSDQHFNKIAQLALGILEQESQFGTSDRYRLKQGLRGVDVGFLSPTIGALLPSSETGVSLFDVIKTVKGNNTYDSLGMGQIKLEGDNEDTQRMYRKFGVTPENVRSDEKTAEAIMIRLLSMYKNEVQGREFKNKETGAVIDPYDALLYKYKGGTAARVLRNGQATGRNEYVQNVKKYSKDFTFYTYK